jgi:hypothetical protein
MGEGWGEGEAEDVTLSPSPHPSHEGRGLLNKDITLTYFLENMFTIQKITNR